jgi:hypothetical protein
VFTRKFGDRERVWEGATGEEDVLDGKCAGSMRNTGPALYTQLLSRQHFRCIRERDEERRKRTEVGSDEADNLAKKHQLVYCSLTLVSPIVVDARNLFILTALSKRRKGIRVSSDVRTLGISRS